MPGINIWKLDSRLCASIIPILHQPLAHSTQSFGPLPKPLGLQAKSLAHQPKTLCLEANRLAQSDKLKSALVNSGKFATLLNHT